MDQKTFNRWRYIRMVLWALSMAITGLIVGSYYPRKVVFVPCFFLCIMVPAVLLPLKPAVESKPED